jgi:peptidoglycan/LPS O-acetylase OafA/YrhL
MCLDADGLSMTQWIGNIFLFEEWRPWVLAPAENRYFLAVAWTLCYEEQFYFLVGMTLLLWPRGLYILFGAFTAFALINNYNLNIGPLKSFGDMNAWKVDVDGLIIDHHWLFFAAGIGLYSFLSARTRWRAIFPAILILLLIWEFRQFDWQTNRFATRTVTFATTLLLCFIHRFDSRICHSRFAAPFNWLGTRTYSIYLVHLPLVVMIVNAESYMGFRRPLFTLLCTIPVSIVVSLVTGSLFFRFVESRYLPTAETSGRRTAVIPV